MLTYIAKAIFVGIVIKRIILLICLTEYIFNIILIIAKTDVGAMSIFITNKYHHACPPIHLHLVNGSPAAIQLY